MALLSRQQSINGRLSRASNADSTQSRAMGSQAQVVQPTGDTLNAAAPGVLSMLKTSTDVGDVGDFSYNTGRLPAALRPTHQRRNNPSRLSTSSNHSAYTYQTNHSRAPSQGSRRTSNAHNHQAWDTVSAISNVTGTGMGARHGSMVSLQTLATIPPYDSRGPPVPRGPPRSSPYGPQMPYPQDGRSYSLTQSHQSSSLRPAKSSTSLRSQGGGQFQPPRPPFAYPARYKRPGFRPHSPASSDYSNSQYSGPYGQPQPFGDDPKYSVDPPLGHSGPSDSGYYPQYCHSQESFHGPPPGRTFGPFPGRSLHRPNLPTYHGDYPQGHLPGPRSSEQPTPHMQQSDQSNLGDPNLYLNYGPHSRPVHPFGNPAFAIMPRVRTPQMEFIPPSSELGTSTPHSPDPPTPRDATTIQVAIDPAFVDPALSELPDEQSDYKSVQSYLKYTEKSAMYELDAAQPAAVELEANALTTRTGIVQRIRNLLEDRVASQEHLTPPSDQKSTLQDTPKKLVVPQHTQDNKHGPCELDVNKTASSYEPFELEAPARITRQLIKANTAPSSSEQNTTTSLVPDTKVKTRSNRAVGPTRPRSPVGDPESTFNGNSTLYRASTKASDEEISTSSESSANKNVDFAVQIKLSEPPSSDYSQPQDTRAEHKLKRHDDESQSGSVSPLRADEKVVRDSVVSPMATQTLQVTAIQDQPKLPGSFPGDIQNAGNLGPGPTARQTLDNSDLVSGLSLPAETSQTFVASPATEPVTDVAIQFSVPRTSDHGRAQLVNLSNLSDTPVRASMEVRKARSAEDSSLQASFSSFERVAPLRIRRMEAVSPMNTVTEGADLSSFIRRSFPRKKSMWSAGQPDAARLSSESLADAALPSSKPLPGYLPDLKEDSKEDMSVRNTRSSDTGMRLPVTPPPGLKTGRGNVRHSEEVPQSSYLSSRPPRMSLSELREIPSLNFSRMDLFDKLNEELETHISRSSKSLAGVKGERRSATHRSSLRPASTEELRERYTSFFTKPEDPAYVDVPQDTLTEGSGVDEETRTETLDHERDDVVNADMLSTRSFARSSRPMSSEQILSVASEVNRLSVPSVAALSERLSELLPSIKHLNLHAIGGEKTLTDTIDKIHHLGMPERDGQAFVRSSTGLRQLAAVAENIVANGTHDSALLEAARSGRLMKELPPLPEDTEQFSLSDSGLDRNTTLITEGLTSTSELEIPKPALLRGKSLMTIDGKEDDLHPGFAPRRSLVLSSQSLRPWNLDENYPWCGNSPAININFPTPVLRRHSSPPELAHGSSQTSANFASETEETLQPDSTLPSSPLISSTDVISPTIVAIHGRKSSKRSLIGSLSRRIGFNTRSQSGSAARDSALAERASPGDRYPYTGLQPPQAFNLEEVRSFFSDSTSDDHGEERRGSFRKHISSFRARSSRLPNGRASAPYSQSLDINRARSLDQHGHASNIHATGSLFDDRFTEPIAPQNYEGMVGMGRMEFRVKRVAERLRHIWLKGGEMIRSISQRSRPMNRRQQREREAEVENWLADSLYSRD